MSQTKTAVIVLMAVVVILLVGLMFRRVRRHRLTPLFENPPSAVIPTSTPLSTGSATPGSMPSSLGPQLPVFNPGDYDETIAEWPGRSYTLHIPPGYDRIKPTPVVLVLHGGGGTGKQIQKATCPDGNLLNPKCMDAVADRNGFIVVYPNGTAGLLGRFSTWNAGGGKNGYECLQGYACAHNINDINYFNDLLDDLERKVAVDSKRVFSTGISNGAAMSQRLGCELANRIAAIAPISGGNQFSAVASCSPGRAVPVMEFHGTADPRSPYNGGQGMEENGIRISVPATISGWVDRNGCNPVSVKKFSLPDKANDGTTVSCDTYSGCRNGADVILYTIVNGGHTWPDGHPALSESRVGKTTHNISANELMIEFFKAHPMVP